KDGMMQVREPPPYWTFFLKWVFGVTDPRLAADLWAEYPKSQALRWQLDICDWWTPYAHVTRARIRTLAALLDPAILIRTSEKLVCPGEPRPPDIAAFQEKVLRATDKEGRLQW